MISEITQLLVPNGSGTYRTLDLTKQLVAEDGLAYPTVEFIRQRGPFQHGDTITGLRLGPRTIQIALAGDTRHLARYGDIRQKLLADTSPVNMLDVDDVIVPYIYRKILRTNRRIWKSDLSTTAGSASVTSLAGHFADWGLGPGQQFTILSGADAATYVIQSVTNENTLVLTTVLSATATNIQYQVTTGIQVRDLQVMIEVGPKFSGDGLSFSNSYKEILRLTAPDPVWYNPNDLSITWSIDVTGNLIFYESPDWTDRLEFPIWFSGDFLISDVTLAYVGTWPSRPQVVLTGPFDNFVLENQSTSDRLVLNYSAASGEIVTLDLYGLEAHNQFGVDLTNYLYDSGTEDSDLVTFKLAPAPQVAGGLNVLHMELTGAIPVVTTVNMSWKTRYAGV